MPEFIDRAKNDLIVEVKRYRADLGRVIDVLGKYAPVFIIAAVLGGLAIPVLIWQGGSMLNALLGARGIGTSTSELRHAIWFASGTFVVLLMSSIVFSRLQGKYADVLAALRDGVLVFGSLFLLTPALYALLVALVAPIFLIVLERYPKIRIVVPILLFAISLQILFASTTSIVLRVTSIGTALRIVFAIFVITFIFAKRALNSSTKAV